MHPDRRRAGRVIRKRRRHLRQMTRMLESFVENGALRTVVNVSREAAEQMRRFTQVWQDAAQQPVTLSFLKPLPERGISFAPEGHDDD